MTNEIADPVPPQNPGTTEIGFAIPQTYNASRILFDNLGKGRRDRPALTGPAGTCSYAELCAEASRWGHGFVSLGLKRGDRILMFLDDTPAYPAAFFGAVRAGFVPLLINTLTPPDLLQFYLSDSNASVAVADAEFCARFDATASKDTALRTLIIVNGTAVDHAVPDTIVAEHWLPAFPVDLAEADTNRNEMAFWMYSSGSTGRPKGIVHLQHDMAYSDAAFARNILKLTPEDICFSVPKMFFAYGFGNSIHGGCCDLAAAGPAQTCGDLCGDRTVSPQRVLWVADALHVVDKSGGRGDDGFLLAAHGAVRRRGAFRRRLQRLEGTHRDRDRRRAGLDGSAAHLSVQPPGPEKARRRRSSGARL
jgi:acyl-CoA synthetase (AMP-forming)/AMP-acid ligase II